MTAGSGSLSGAAPSDVDDTGAVLEALASQPGRRQRPEVEPSRTCAISRTATAD